jgi:uncharacterized membrane protein (DUF373 family)
MKMGSQGLSMPGESRVIEKNLNRAVYWIEALVAVILVLLTLLALIGLSVAVWQVAANGLALPPAQFTRVVSLVLEVFILIELFRIAIAYMTHRNVIPTVLEAALVAVARKFVIFEPGANFIAYAGGHAALLLAVAISWWLLSRAQACAIVQTEQS